MQTRHSSAVARKTLESPRNLLEPMSGIWTRGQTLTRRWNPTRSNEARWLERRSFRLRWHSSRRCRQVARKTTETNRPKWPTKTQARRDFWLGQALDVLFSGWHACVLVLQVHTGCRRIQIRSTRSGTLDSGKFVWTITCTTKMTVKKFIQVAGGFLVRTRSTKSYENGFCHVSISCFCVLRPKTTLQKPDIESWFRTGKSRSRCDILNFRGKRNPNTQDRVFWGKSNFSNICQMQCHAKKSLVCWENLWKNLIFNWRPPNGFPYLVNGSQLMPIPDECINLTSCRLFFQLGSFRVRCWRLEFSSQRSVLSWQHLSCFYISVPFWITSITRRTLSLGHLLLNF